MDRLLGLVFHLLNKRKATSGELAARFEVSERTILRDVGRLSAAGLPVHALRGQGGGIALMDGCVLDRAVFTAEERELILLGVSNLPAASPEARDRVLDKLRSIFGQPAQDWLEVDLSRWGGVGGDGGLFAALREAIVLKRAVGFEYVDADGRPSSRAAFPLRLAFKGQAWYLQAFCLARKDHRTFRLSRMSSLALTGESFAGLDLAAPPIGTPGGRPSRPARLVLRVSPSAAHRALDEFDRGSVRREDDGSLLVEALWPEDDWLYGFLLSFGASIEILEPRRVRRRLLGMVESMKINLECQET
jgi:predicted DNA-binding transcriptional regulator YafY